MAKATQELAGLGKQGCDGSVCLKREGGVATGAGAGGFRATASAAHLLLSMQHSRAVPLELRERELEGEKVAKTLALGRVRQQFTRAGPRGAGAAGTTMGTPTAWEPATKSAEQVQHPMAVHAG